MYLTPCNDPFSLDDLAARIRASSNFRFAWQFYRCEGINLRSPMTIRRALEAVIVVPELHAFLRDSFEDMGVKVFDIRPLHEHCSVAVSDDFDNLLARAAGDHLGAYSKILRDAKAAERQAVRELFQSIGEYQAYELQPGRFDSCRTCRSHNNHLFSSWFDEVAWDWCLFAAWPDSDVLWIGCLTDTD